MVRLINLTTGYKKCLETYFNKNINYLDSLSTKQTITGSDPFEMQKEFMKNSYFPWIVQKDITTQTTATNNADMLNTATNYFVQTYLRHPVQFYSVLEVACVYTTVVNIANKVASSDTGDYVKQVFTDTIDSVAV
jgi:outer membrane receptor for ferrienterochelin and colicin